MSREYVQTIEADVAVSGAGVAGLCAAIQAARDGKKVILIEGSDRLGGIMTVCQGMPLGCGFPLQVSVGGMFQEILDRINEKQPDATWMRLLPDSPYGWDVFYNQDAAMAVLYDMLDEAGVELIIRAITGDVIMDGNTITGLEYHDMTGTNLVKAKMFIDCTGNGDLAARAGVPYEVGDDKGRMMAGTLTFIMSNVDTDKAFPSPKAESNDVDLEKLYEKGLVSKDNKTVRYTRTANKNQAFFNWATARGSNGLDPKSVLECSSRARKSIFALADFLRANVPGFENAYLDGIGPTIGIRDTRRFEGLYYLTEKDLLSHKKFPVDGIVCCDNVFDEVGRGEDGETSHDSIVTEKNTDYYMIPFGTLIPKKVKNLMFAGRIMSADSRAMTSSRGMATCMIMGQAVGAACTPAIDRKLAVQDVPASEVVAKLKKLGVTGLAGEHLKEAEIKAPEIRCAA